MVKHHKGIMVILDGLGDRGIVAFGGKTPLEAAKTPNLDRLAARGQTGLVDPLVPGLPLSTHTATGLLFGLPHKVARELARGPVEAAGIRIADDPHGLYIRGNFATLEKTDRHFSILDRRAGRIDAGTDLLARELGEIRLGEQITATLHPATHHRVVIKLSGPGLSANITNTDPGNRYHELGVLECRAINAEDAAALHTAQAINRLTNVVHEKLSEHPVNLARLAAGDPPANGIICRSPGKLPKIRTTIEHLKLKTAVIAGEKTVLGLAAMLGYTQIKDPGFTSLPDTDLQKKVALARHALADHDLVYLHIKGPDICAHDLDPVAKRKLLEAIDDAIAPLLQDDLVIGITGDHSTDSNTGRHSGDPVPSLLCAPHGRLDQVTEFGEASCAGGGLGRINSFGFLLSLLDLMNLLENYHREDADLYF
ncbi:MAG: phosphoglycerate mutase [Gammaproteobacteria bacterium]|nr:phosphoglycerate mutase [Gammaproteobacteria bacterium]